MNVILFNPRSAEAKHRIPNSILQVASSIQDKHSFFLVDGNLEKNPLAKIKKLIEENNVHVFASTVMPGPQLKQAIPFSKEIKHIFPHIYTIWGGYFASNQYEVSLNSGYVDYIINGPGDFAFPKLLDVIENNSYQTLASIKNLIYRSEEKIIKTAKDNLPDMDKIPSFPYEKLNQTYAIENYLGKTFLGKRTFTYHSSFGCPFTCSFCAVVPIYEARWKGMSTERIMKDVNYFKEKYQIDAIEFQDNNFFTSRNRVVEFSNSIIGKDISWWGEGRIDTIDKYSDDDLALMKKSGLKMIFLGAETGSDEVLKKMDKGGTQTGDQIKKFAARLKKFDIIPEYSFVLGLPGETEEQVNKQINDDINFIREIKKINPQTEIIIYVYSPTPVKGSELFNEIEKNGFKFPEKLEDWLSPSWEKFDQRKNPLTPWLKPYMIQRIKNFETVLNGYYPTVSDFRIKGPKKIILKLISYWRYKLKFYYFPYEIKLLHKIWKYRQPEVQGFYAE